MPAKLIALLLSLAAIAAMAACAPDPAPTPTPGGLDDALPALILRGATIQQAVSGDAGCPSSGLHSNALRLRLSLAGDEGSYTVYLFRWRRPADFAAAAQPFSDCVDEFVADSEGEVPVDDVEAPPWRAYGPGWSEELRQVVEEALRDIGNAQ